MLQQIRPDSDQVRSFILRHIGDPHLASKVSSRFHITRQAANKHLRNLVAAGDILAEGETRKRSYKLARSLKLMKTYLLSAPLDEDQIWRQDIRPVLGPLPQNVLNLWQWAFTEMLNNANDHSEGTRVAIQVEGTALYIEMCIRDNGIGIFRKLMDRFNLDDERQALLELSKGKLTTAPKQHSGQGIFFTSRMVDDFTILSGQTYFRHESPNDDDWLMESSPTEGTAIFLRLSNSTPRTTKKVLAKYSVEGSYGFNKTVVPVELARYGTDQLISRSQAKRVLARVDQFSQVLLDFRGVNEIGQAFADEVFRVFGLAHPGIALFPINANKAIMDAYRGALKDAKQDRKKLR